MLLLMSCCRDNSEVRDALVARHKVMMERHRVRYMVPGKDILKGAMACERSMMDTKMIKNRFLDILKNHAGCVGNEKEVAQDEKADRIQVSVRKICYRQSLFFKTVMKASRVYKESFYFEFTFEPLHTQYL